VCRKQLYRQYSGVSLSTTLHRTAVVRLRGQLLRFLCYIYQFELLRSRRVRCTAQAIVLQARPALSLPILLYVLASELSHPPYTDFVKLKNRHGRLNPIPHSLRAWPVPSPWPGIRWLQQRLRQISQLQDEERRHWTEQQDQPHQIQRRQEDFPLALPC
jgi:hypothetical protein